MKTNIISPFSNQYLEFIELGEYQFGIKNSFGKVFYDFTYEPEYKIMIQRFHTFIPDQDLKEIYYAFNRFCAENKLLVIGCISDITAFDGSFDGISEWLYTEFLPQSVKYGYRFDAIVKPNDFYTQLALDEIRAYPKEFENEIFDTFDEGYQWLIEKTTNYLNNLQ